MTKLILRCGLVVLLATVPLAGCGKKGQPAIPNGEKSTYPHAYPVAPPSEPPPDAAADAPKTAEPAADDQAKP